MIVYDKLVRDKIPENIRKSGNECEVEIVDDATALEYLYKKLQEEVDELLADKNLEEIADVAEVLFSIAKKNGYSEEDVMNKRKEKLEKAGGFEDNIILKKTFINNK